MAIIERNQYLNALAARKDNGRVKVITGIRRCGKSFLLSTLYKRYLLENGIPASQIIEIALDEIAQARYRNPLELDAHIRSKVSDASLRYYVFIDEIQLCTKEKNPFTSDPEDVLTFVDAVLGLQRLSNVDLYITGSNSKMLSSDIMTQFEDRGDDIHLAPLSFAEFVPACPDRAHALRDYLTFGGMPHVLAENTVEDKSRYLKALFAETYLKDIIERNRIRGDKDVLDVLLDFVASSTGSLTNPTKLSNRFASERGKKVGHSTIEKYLGYFQDAFVLERVQRFDVRGGGYFQTPCKYYFADTGLRNARLNFRQNDENHLLENAVYNDLVRRGFNVDVGVVPFCMRSAGAKAQSGQLEIDFVANRLSTRYYIQVAQGIDDEGKREQESRPFGLIGDSFKRVVVVKDDIIPWHDERGVLYLGIERFLLDDNAINL